MVVRSATTSYWGCWRKRWSAQALSLPPLQLRRMRFGWRSAVFVCMVPLPRYIPEICSIQMAYSLIYTDLVYINWFAAAHADSYFCIIFQAPPEACIAGLPL